MSEEVKEQEACATEEIPAAEPTTVAADETKKAVKFEQNELTFDEAQAEIDAIKARAGQARESLKSAPVSAPISSSYGSSYASNSASGYSLEDEPKSKNMLSHLNSHSAMINYKVQAARSLVRKQEDLLRNLARMRENMERSENELGKASDYYSTTRYQPRGYFERKAESAPLISRRQQVRDVSPVISNGGFDIQNISDADYTFATPHVSCHISDTPTRVVSSSDYQPDAEFEKEMAAIRKRVADLSRQANEVTTPKYNSYDYDSSLTTNHLRRGYGDIHSTPEVKTTKSHKHPSRSRTYQPILPARTSYTTTKHVVADADSPSYYPCNSYTDYLMDSVNELDYPSNVSTGVNQTLYGDSELQNLYADPLSLGVTDYHVAY